MTKEKIERVYKLTNLLEFKSNHRVNNIEIEEDYYIDIDVSLYDEHNKYLADIKIYYNEEGIEKDNNVEIYNCNGIHAGIEIKTEFKPYIIFDLVELYIKMYILVKDDVIDE